jgi:DNA-binding NarL/FixJ family response regulator
MEWWSGGREGIVEKIKLVLADDHALLLEALMLLLSAVSEFDVIGTARNGSDAVRLTKQGQPEVVLLDLAMPILDGVGAARQILRVLPRTRILILSAFLEPVHVRCAMEIRAAGYLFKGCPSQKLVQSIFAVQKGEYCFPEGYSGLGACVMGHGRACEAVSLRRSLLTQRETEVLRRVALGRANKESACELGISIKTVEKHRQRLMEKLGIHETAGLTRYAIGVGLV